MSQVPKSIFECKRSELTGYWREFWNEEMVLLFIFDGSGDVEVSKTFSIRGSKTEYLFENHVEYLGHGVQYNTEMYCREAVYHMGYWVME